MSVVPAKLDMLAFARSLLPVQYRNLSNWDKLLRVIAKPFQDLEDAFIDLLEQRYVSVATGATLDKLGEIVGQKRNGQDDTAYRIRVKARIRLILSSGTPPQIIELLNALHPAGTKRYTPYYPASFVVEVLDPITAVEAVELGAMVKAAKAAGVKGDINYSLRARSATFGFASGATPEVNASRGFSNTSRTTGGKMAGVA